MKTMPAPGPFLRNSSCKIALSLLVASCVILPVNGAPSPTGAESLPSAITPNQFQGTDTERINRAVAAAAETGCRVVVPPVNFRNGRREDTWLLDSAIVLPSHTTLELDNCHIKLSDRCRDNFIRRANCGPGITKIEPLEDIHIRGIGRPVLEGADHPRATGDGAKTIGQRTYGTDAGVDGESQTGDWRNIGILLAFVEHFSIENLAVKDSHAWAISLERCAHGRLRDIDFDSTQFKMIDGTRQTILNQDGIDLRLGCHDILIENISGRTGDDLIALTAIPRADAPAGGTESTMVTSGADRGGGADDIRQVVVRNIQGYSHGGHHIVRLLNTPGVRMHDVVIDGLIDTSPEAIQCKAAVKIGDHAYGGGVAPVGDTSRILVSNVISKAKHTILVGGSLCDSVLSNIVCYGSGAEAITVVEGPEYLRDVTVSNLKELGAAGE